MKTTLVLTSFLALILLAGCAKAPAVDTTTDAGTGTQTGTEAVVPSAADSKKGTEVKVATEQKVFWQGEKVGGIHTGTVNVLPESFITVDSTNRLLGGKMTIAMNTIMEGENTSGGVIDHLKKEDFFDVASHPTAVIVAKSVMDGNMTADLTIRGITKEITVPVTLVQDGDGLLLSAQLEILLKDFDIGQTLIGKVALKDTFSITLDKVAFLK
ncbi:MAG: YceI family protein [Candidatus Absconditabacterales bacterium]